MEKTKTFKYTNPDTPTDDPIPINFIGCRICGKRTEVKSGFKYGVTLRKDPFVPGMYLCEKHTEKNELPWRLKAPNEFRAMLSQLGNPNRGKKKTMSRMKKARA